MSEWSNQITELQRSWVEQQQKLLSDWLGSMKSTSGDSSRANWRKATDVMEQQVDSALKVRKRSLMVFAENMEKVEGAPEAFTEAVKQLEQSLEQWAEIQHRIWGVWFDMVRATVPAPQTPGEAMMESWEEMVKRTMAIQEQWLSNWMGQQTEPAQSSAGKSTSPDGPRK